MQSLGSQVRLLVKSIHLSSLLIVLLDTLYGYRPRQHLPSNSSLDFSTNHRPPCCIDLHMEDGLEWREGSE